jgi:hypothetical protein
MVRSIVAAAGPRVSDVRPFRVLMRSECPQVDVSARSWSMKLTRRGQPDLTSPHTVRPDGRGPERQVESGADSKVSTTDTRASERA